jgi:oligopeptidase B
MKEIIMKRHVLLSITVLVFAACTNNNNTVKKETYHWPEGITPPVAEKKPKELIAHGDVRIDEYYWMNDFFKKGPDSVNVVEYLNAENAYLDTMMAGTKELQTRLYAEMKARIKGKDESVPVFNNGYYYYSRTEEGKQYFKYCRRKGNMDAAEEILLDADALAEGQGYFSIGALAVSPDTKKLIYAVDTVSRRQYVLYIKDLETGEILKDQIKGTGTDIAWGNDNNTFFYVHNNPKTLLSEKIKRHSIGTAASRDVVVYEEKDPSNYIGVSKTRSRKFIVISSEATLSSEVRILDADTPLQEFQVFQPRIKEVLYDIDHWNDKFLIVTNLDAKNYKLMETPVNNTSKDHWKDVIAHRSDVLLEDVSVFKDHWLIEERKEGLVRLRIRELSTGNEHYIDFGEPAYSAEASFNPEFSTAIIRFDYESMTTPHSVFSYDMQAKEKKLLKETEVLGGYKKEDYVSERVYATGSNGVKIPVSIVYKKGTKKDGSAPLLLYAYGSYGYSLDADFESERISLLDRGFIYAMAHIRGGEEMGRHWYDEGKMMNKKNTFTDFIDCGKYLIDQKYTSIGHLYAMGGSAGGLLMGAVANMAPQLWNGIIAEVPFVDVVTTMSDPTIPLTTNEYDEWGNPENKDAYFYMKSYSPYDNIEKKDYPNMLVMTGLHDSQVQYFEPAKWVARLRAMKTGNHVLLLKTDMEAGHGGASGRFDYLKDVALQYAFLTRMEHK